MRPYGAKVKAPTEPNRASTGGWLLFENHPFAQAEAPNTLHGHSDELANGLGKPKSRISCTDKPGAKSEVPQVEQHKQDHAAHEVAGCFEGDVAVHQKIERARARNGDAVGHARSQTKRLHNGENRELNNRLNSRNTIVSYRLLGGFAP